MLKEKKNLSTENSISSKSIFQIEKCYRGIGRDTGTKKGWEGTQALKTVSNHHHPSGGWARQGRNRMLLLSPEGAVTMKKKPSGGSCNCGWVHAPLEYGTGDRE